MALVTSGLERRRFVGDGWLYRGLDLQVPTGTILAVVGPNGAGKSTLLRDLSALTPLQAGTVRLGDDDAHTLHPGERARRLSYLPQHHDFPHDLPVCEVVALGRAPHRTLFGGLNPSDHRAIDAALAATDTAHLRERGILRLSGGERQRVMLARMLATRTDVLVLDEPTTALDVGHALTLLARLRALASEGRSIVFSAHDLEHARRTADEVLVLSGEPSGRSVCGPVDQTLIPGVLDEVFNVRTRVTDDGLSFVPAPGPAG